MFLEDGDLDLIPRFVRINRVDPLAETPKSRNVSRCKVVFLYTADRVFVEKYPSIAVCMKERHWTREAIDKNRVRGFHVVVVKGGHV